MFGKGKKIEEDAPESPPEDSGAGIHKRCPPEDVQEMVKIKGFKTLEEMVGHFLNKMMEQYYQKKEADRWQ